MWLKDVWGNKLAVVEKTKVVNNCVVLFIGCVWHRDEGYWSQGRRLLAQFGFLSKSHDCVVISYGL